MKVECGAIIIIIGMIAYSAMRSGRYCFSIGVLPLAIVPFTHLMGSVIAKGISKITQLPYIVSWIMADVAALVVACLFFGVLSMNFKEKKMRYSYLILCGGFSLVLTCVMIAKLIRIL